MLDERVSALLKAAPAYRTLARPRRGALQGSITNISRALLSSEADVSVDEVNFPKLVEDLLKGTFEAVVDTSIQQMEAYAGLVQDVATSIDQFLTENTSDEEPLKHSPTLS